MRRSGLGIAAAGLAFAAGCATEGGPGRPGWSGGGSRDRIVQAARQVAKTATHYARGGQGREGGYDCSGFVAAIYRTFGMEVMPATGAGNGVTRIHDWCIAHGHPPMMRQPRPGDLVFLDESYDRTGDGRVNARDTLTHIGIVETVKPDGTFIMLHAAGHAEGITRTPYEWTRRPKKAYGRISGVVLVPPD